jgi:hypothetical protein
VIAFLQPLGLVALVAVAVPPLLHLLGRRRPAAVPFPAVQYLSETAREHSRRLRIRHLVLLALRMLVLALVALAAARPVTRAIAGRVHPSTALALVLDNSLSSGSVSAGRRQLDRLVERARAVVQEVAPGDELWLVLADGIPRRLTPSDARAAVASAEPLSIRLDLSEAVRAAGHVLERRGFPLREIVVLSDLQATAFSPGDTVAAPVLLLAPPAPSENRSVDGATAAPVVWSPSGKVVARLAGTLAGETAVRLDVDGREVARTVGIAGAVAALDASASVGWHRAEVRLGPDELRADDDWWLAIRGAPPPAVQGDSGAGTFVAAAVGVLLDGGRVVRGNAITLSDRLAPGITVLFPPSDPALVGALNRGLEGRGISLRFGARVDGEWLIAGAGPADGATVTRRQRITGGTVIATADGDPWLVRDGPVVAVGSRLEPAWTTLPLRAGFVPFLDFVLRRVALQEVAIEDARCGEGVAVPTGVRSLAVPGADLPVAGGTVTAPLVPGVYFLLGSTGDTVGALQVNHDPRESRLAPAPPAAVRAALGADARVLSASGLERELFGGARRAELAPWLLVAALVLLVVELAVATWGAVRTP